MGIVEGYALGQLQSQVEGAHRDIVNTYDNVTSVRNKLDGVQTDVFNTWENVNRVHEKLDALLADKFVTVDQHQKVVDQHKDLAIGFNKLREQFIETHVIEAQLYRDREAAIQMLMDLTGREYQDILDKEVRDQYGNNPRVLGKLDAYIEEREQYEREAGVRK